MGPVSTSLYRVRDFNSVCVENKVRETHNLVVVPSPGTAMRKKKNSLLSLLPNGMCVPFPFHVCQRNLHLLKRGFSFR